jgi:peptidoglycan/LPS O-acetylase OafA/YrhL
VRSSIRSAWRANASNSSPLCSFFFFPLPPGFMGPPSPLSQPPTALRDELRYLDGLRGVACLIVFNWHFTGYFFPIIITGRQGPGALVSAPPYPSEPASDPLTLLLLCCRLRQRPPLPASLGYSPWSVLSNGPFSVSLFFVLSGRILAASYLTRKQPEILASAAIRRIIRLGLPSAVVVLVSWMVARAGGLHAAALGEMTNAPWPPLLFVGGDLGRVSWGQMRTFLLSLFQGSMDFDPNWTLGWRGERFGR